MMRDRGRTDQPLEIAATKPSQRELPEHFSVVAEHTDLPEDVPEHDQGALDIGPALLLGRHRHLDPLRVGVVALILVARVELFGLVGDFHAFAPGLDNLLIGQQELDIGIAAVVVIEPALALQPVPQRRLRQRLQ